MHFIQPYSLIHIQPHEVISEYSSAMVREILLSWLLLRASGTPEAWESWLLVKTRSHWIPQPSPHLLKSVLPSHLPEGVHSPLHVSSDQRPMYLKKHCFIYLFFFHIPHQVQLHLSLGWISLGTDYLISPNCCWSCNKVILALLAARDGDKKQ